MTRAATWLATVVALAACTPEPSPMFDRLEYMVPDMEEAPELLVVTSDGGVRLDSHSSARARSAEIGTYATELDEAALGALAAAVEPLPGLPDHTGRVRPGEDYRRVRLAAGEVRANKLIGPREPVDPALDAILKRLDALRDQALRSPVSVLRIELVDPTIEPSPEPGQLLAVTARLTNRGRAPVRCRGLVGAGAEVRFDTWPDLPRAEVKDDEWLGLEPLAVEDPRPATDPPGLVTLQPGERLDYRLRVQLPPCRARRAVRLMYCAEGDRLGEVEVQVGEVFSNQLVLGS